MKTFKLENKPKMKSGFSTPENYFEDFSTKFLHQLPSNKPKVISIFSRRKIGICSAAAGIVLALTIPVYNKYHTNSSEVDIVTLENYIAYHSTVSDIDLVNLLDEKDIQKINIDFNLEDKNIEDELSANKNLEHYILN